MLAGLRPHRFNSWHGRVKTPEQSNCHVAPLHILFGDDVAHGWYYGSDAVRSPLDVYRGPGDAPYESDTW